MEKVSIEGERIERSKRKRWEEQGGKEKSQEEKVEGGERQKAGCNTWSWGLDFRGSQKGGHNVWSWRNYPVYLAQRAGLPQRNNDQDCTQLSHSCSVQITELCTIITPILYLRQLRLKCQVKDHTEVRAEPGNTSCHVVWLQCSLDTSTADADGGKWENYWRWEPCHWFRFPGAKFWTHTLCFGYMIPTSPL